MMTPIARTFDLFMVVSLGRSFGRWSGGNIPRMFDSSLVSPRFNGACAFLSVPGVPRRENWQDGPGG
jgi:hypothetical protein